MYNRLKRENGGEEIPGFYDKGSSPMKIPLCRAGEMAQ